MSTQKESGLDFFILPEESQQHFRLLELPAELLSWITADNASPLQLKTAETLPGSLTGPTVVLCTRDKTYNVRQVSTSNSVFVVQPSVPPDDALSEPGLQAIAQCTSTLELLPGGDSMSVAHTHIKAALPVYTSTGHQDAAKRITKQQLFASIPLSEAECQHAWADLACFGLDGGATLPSDRVRLEVWQEILITATAGGIDLTSEIEFQQLHSVVSEEAEWPTALCMAVLMSVSLGSSSEATIQLHGDRLAKTVGLILLRERTANGHHTVNLTIFEKEWANLLPEAWRPKAAIDCLGRRIRRENGGKDVTFVDSDASKAATADGGAQGDAKSTAGAKRKWHEKFRASKKPA